MKDIRLMALNIENFKGCRRLSLAFGGKNASIYGENEVGKTTIYDAMTWLLFGKDSKGQSNFAIKPLDAKGEVLDHGAITTVAATFRVEEDGDAWEVVLLRSFSERWSTKRGSDNATFDGHTTDFFVDGVPVKKYEFEERVAKLVDEEMFRLLTDVAYFGDKMEWKQRRQVLFQMCGTASDEEIMAQEATFAPLAQACAGRISVEDLKKKLLAQRKGLSVERNNVPVRLDECQKTIQSLEGIDYAALRRERDTRAAKREALQGELLKLEHNNLLDSKRNERAALENRRDKLIMENAAHRRSQENHEPDPRPKLDAALRSAKQQASAAADRALQRKAAMEGLDASIQRCREDWKQENARLFAGADCPTCGQPLPPEQMQRVQQDFEAEKKRRQDRLVQESGRYKAMRQEAADSREQYIQEAVAAENQAAQLEAQLAGMPEKAAPVVEDMPGYQAARDALDKELAALEDEIFRLTRETGAIREETKDRLRVLAEEIGAIENTLAQESLLQTTRNRMDTLRAEAAKAAAQMGELDDLLALCDEFTRYKVNFVEDSINSRFQMARFRLFAEQVNGGVADCCEVTVKGVPYTSMNNAARINSGMDIIQTLSAHYQVRAPLFVDNAESVVELFPMDAQVIRLVVSAGDKELRCEYEN